MRKILVILATILFCLPSWGAQFTLVIDPGHGGKDAGAVGSFSKEKNINLSVALAFGQYVERNCPDVKVIYTRKTDVFIELMQRANIANRNKADLFISVHTNALPKGRISRGFETYTLGMHRAGDNLDVAKRENSVITMEAGYQSKYQGFDPNSAESYIMFEYMQDKNMENSVKLAKLIQSNVCSSASRQNKGVHQAGFLVLRETSMPSCLVELGFISTPDEEAQLNDPIVQNQLAYGLYQAFMKYRGKTAEPLDPSAAIEPAKPLNRPSGIEPSAAIEPTKPLTHPSGIEPSEAIEPAKPLNRPSGIEPSAAPIFKVQFVSLSKQLKPTDASFKGLTDVDFYRDGNMYKYTCGASADYREIQALQKKVAEKFPQCFIVAFLNGNRIDSKEAVRLWRARK